MDSVIVSCISVCSFLLASGIPEASAHGQTTHGRINSSEENKYGVTINDNDEAVRYRVVALDSGSKQCMNYVIELDNATNQPIFIFSADHWIMHQAYKLRITYKNGTKVTLFRKRPPFHSNHRPSIIEPGKKNIVFLSIGDDGWESDIGSLEDIEEIYVVYDATALKEWAPEHILSKSISIALPIDGVAHEKLINLKPNPSPSYRYILAYIVHDIREILLKIEDEQHAELLHSYTLYLKSLQLTKPSDYVQKVIKMLEKEVWVKLNQNKKVSDDIKIKLYTLLEVLSKFHS